MAHTYAERNFASVFVYTRETHPGENYPAHANFDQKLTHARAFRELFDVQRPILVDDLEGTVHQLYGMLPNMTYLIGQGGKVLFKSDWTDPPTIQWVMDYILDARQRRREGLRLAPFYAELVGYRWNDQEKHLEGLRRAGQQAADDSARRQSRVDDSAGGRIRLA